VLVDLDVVALVVEHPHQPRMGDRYVVALDVVVGDDLPVGGLGAVARGKRHERRDPVALQPLRQVADHVCQRGRVGVEVEEHKAAHLLDADGHQAKRALVELLAEREALRDADQRAVEGVRPAVVATPDRALALSLAAEQPRRAVAAHVAVRAQLF
jgi:hypothetical protein